MNAGTRLLLPAGSAWASAWLAVGMTAAGARTVAAVCWAVAALGLLAGLLAARASGRRPRPRRAAGPGPGAGDVDRAAPPAPGRAGRRCTAIAWAPMLAVVAAAAALAASAAASGATLRTDSPLAVAAADGKAVEVVVQLGSAPRAAPGFGSGSAPATTGGAGEGMPRLRRLSVEATVREVDGRAARGIPVLLTAELPDGPALAFGARVALTVRAEPLDAADAEAFRLTGVGGARGGATVTPAAPWLAWAGGLRAGFSAEAAALAGGDGGALVPGLAIGDTSLVSDGLDAAMKSASLSHLTAVSGANCVLVTAGVLLLGAALRLPRPARLLLAGLALAAFVVLVTPQSSVIRAAAMSVVVLIGLGSGRGAGGRPALGLAVVVLVCADPWFARDYGFALSVLATAGLLLLSGPLARRLEAWLPRPLAIALAVPLAAQLACQPVLVLLDPGIAGLGVVANLLAEPVAPIGTVVGLLACLLLPVLPGPAEWMLEAATLPAGWIAGVARAVAAMPLNRVPWVPGALGAVLLAAGTAACLVLLLGGRAGSGARSEGRRPFGAGRGAIPPTGAGRRILALLVVVGTLVVPLGALLGGPAIVRAARPADWNLAQCDVGQGDAVLLRSAGRIALIDTGPDPAALTRCRELLGIGRVDLLVLTHWDADHVGGTAAVVGDVGVVLVGPADGERSARVVDPLAAAGARIVPASLGLGGRLGGLDWRVRWPADPDSEPGNAASVVVEFAGDGWHGLFLGDLGEDAQRAMLRSGAPETVDVVKVAHHGSADQSAELYARLHAAVGLIGVGVDNGYGHPTARLLDLLATVGTRPLRSDRLGTLVLRRTPDGFVLWSERADHGPPAPTAVSAAGRRLARADGRMHGTARGSHGGGDDGLGEVVDPAARLARGASGSRRARHRRGGLPRRSGDPATARLPPLGGPVARGA